MLLQRKTPIPKENFLYIKMIIMSKSEFYHMLKRLYPHSQGWLKA
jgi:hypothetical protein